MLRVYTSTTPAVDAARRLYDVLIEHQHADVLLLLSGGSACSVLEHLNTTLLSERVTISLLDERYTYDESVSNFSHLTRTSFWERASKQHVGIIDPRPTEGEDLLATSKRFEVALKYWHIIHHNGVVIALFGLGEDGHTAGILPFPHNPDTFKKLFLPLEKIVRGYHIDARVNEYQDRMTVTGTYLKRHVSHAVVFLTGAKKQNALVATLSEDGDLHITPARILQTLNDVAIYTDIPVLDTAS